MKPATFLFLLMICAVVDAQQKEVMYLSGKDANKTVQWDFFCTAGRKSGIWTRIAVPSCWEQQGFGNYNYGRDYKTNGKNSRFYDEKGMYRYQFKVPATWKGRQVDIVFDGSMTDTEVRINGKPAGDIHQGAFYRFRYDISSLLQYDRTNTLEVTVSKMSSDASVNNAERLADYWVFGGIFRPVFLEAMPREHISYVGINAKADGRFSMKVQLPKVLPGFTVAAEIIGPDHTPIGQLSGPAGKETVLVLNKKLENVSPWTSETPVLYTAHIVLKNASGRKVYALTEKFGFRTIEVRRGQGVFINGVQVKFKGVNRHCFWPETARTLSEEQQLLDVQLLKEMNMNAVRCSHYPPDKYFLRLCDSLGLYVLNELAGWQKAYSTKAGEPLVKELVLRDMNHASIIFWNNGNEGGTNKELDDDFALWDFQQRPVLHPHHRPGNHFNGIDCNHYEDYYSTQKILNDSLIYMPTEFLHAQDDGGGAAAMEDFWELHWKSPRSAGGFIWAMVDEAVVRTDLNGALDANGLNANDGILGPHREKEGSYYALREIFSPLKIDIPAHVGSAFDGRIGIENRYHFLNTKQCRLYWALVDFSKPFDRFDGYIVRQKGQTSLPDIAPGAKGELRLLLPTPGNYDALVLVAQDNFGKEIYKWIATIKEHHELIGSLVTVKADTTSKSETDSSYVLRGGDVAVSFDKKSGYLLGSRNATNDYLLSFSKGPVPVHGSATLTAARLYSEGAEQVAEFTYSGSLRYARWKMHASGWVSLEYEYAMEGDLPFTGISFDYPENYVLAARWLGKGPVRQWKNRMAGTPINVWQNIYNNTHTGYSPVVYPEFKGYFGNVAWMELSTVEGKFYMASPDTGLFVRLFDFYALSAAGKPHPEIPVGNISFLDCIPPIGTKLALGLTTNTKVYGPQSELNHVSGSRKRTLYFYFGLPKTTDSKEQYTRPAIDEVF